MLLLQIENPAKFRTPLPKDFLFERRTLLGVCAMLARLRAEVDCRSVAIETLYQQGDVVPAPYTPAELALLSSALGVPLDDADPAEPEGS